MARRSLFRLDVTLVAVLMLWTPVGAPSQDRPFALEQYDRVCDSVFPINTDQPWESRIILRYRPSFSTESQIQISKTTDGYWITYWHIPEGQKSIWEQMDELSRRKEDYRVEEIAAEIKARRHVLRVHPKDLDSVINDLSKWTAPPKESTIVVDGTRYDLWFEVGSQMFRMHYSFADQDFGSKRYIHPLAEWMNKVREQVLQVTKRDKPESNPKGSSAH